MKYTVEIKNDKAIETLNISGKTYTRTTCRTLSGGSRSDDADFCEQMQDDGFSDETLDQIYDTLDGFLTMDLLQIAESEGVNETI